MTYIELVLGTTNPGKIAEMRAVLAHLPIRFRTLEEFPDVPAVEESGCSYEENAALKAKAYSRRTGSWALADDSGLEVDALDGAPGLLSARYGGPGSSDCDRINLLLEQLAGARNSFRSARFVCVIALADPASRVIECERASCAGTIAHSPHGSSGFGYDPIFVPKGFHATFAELPFDIKNSISHRGKALQATRHLLARLVAEDLTPRIFSS